MQHREAAGECGTMENAGSQMISRQLPVPSRDVQPQTVFLQDRHPHPEAEGSARERERRIKVISGQ